VSELTITKTNIPGLLIINLPLHGDERGWFKENYQKEKMEALGLPPFTVIQNNFSYNQAKGVTRGLHAEPWEKYISLANGSVFGAWVDLRAGDSFGQTFSIEITPSVAIFVPRGVANGYQTLEEKVTYTYLVNEHWSPEANYTFVNAFDPAVAVPWPIPKEQSIVSEKDEHHPMLAEVIPMEVTHE
jgi:dTDP-4-dehydrorhamnose 3,5-epimerase